MVGYYAIHNRQQVSKKIICALGVIAQKALLFRILLEFFINDIIYIFVNCYHVKQNYLNADLRVVV